MTYWNQRLLFSHNFNLIHLTLEGNRYWITEHNNILLNNSGLAHNANQRQFYSSSNDSIPLNRKDNICIYIFLFNFILYKV